MKRLVNHMRPRFNSILFFCIGCSSIVSVPISAWASEYFVTPDEVKIALADINTVVLDARANKGDYAAGHIPGARHVAWETFARTDGKPGLNWGVLLPKDRLAKALGKLGIHARSRVVIYIDPLTGWGEDGRFLWMLRMLGVTNSQILDGGLKVWKAKGYPVTREVPKPAPAKFTISKIKTDLVADTGWIQKHHQGLKIVDSRHRREFLGAIEYGEARGGRLPGAIPFHYRRVLKPDGMLKSKADIAALLRQAGLKKEDDIAVYCTAGVRSAHLTMVMRMLGYAKARNYDASFYHWAADESLDLR